MGGGGGEGGGRQGNVGGGACTSSKGQFDGSQPNDQPIESPLKKQKKNCEKMLIVKRVSTSTKMRVAEAKKKPPSTIQGNLGDAY
jgi:hypothetical protein